ncbi:hypothetical protein [Paenibacillus silviterrae]|uniref:hypothetical protein n=1 Tax=Paenibacillus silviterrae TaxID=3242194 RepID=UPI002542B61D|nr:hypothetical protein [Paenibacillus chinjuensis]
MITIIVPKGDYELADELQLFSEAWDLTVRRTAEGYLLQPEYLMSIHGISAEEQPAEWRFTREIDATTWEDFLLMHITHYLAGKHGLLLQYETVKGIRWTEPTPQEFATFDLYVGRVLRGHEGLVRDMKKNWIYAHRTRYTH